jgi:hypothetical protein
LGQVVQEQQLEQWEQKVLVLLVKVVFLFNIFGGGATLSGTSTLYLFNSESER